MLSTEACWLSLSGESLRAFSLGGNPSLKDLSLTLPKALIAGEEDSLSFRGGPPTLAPNLVLGKRSTGEAAAVSKKPFAFSTLFRRNSYAEPW